MNEILKERRELAGFKQLEMANEVGISKSYYSLIENGSRRVSYELAYKIAEVLNTTPDSIFLDFESTKSKQEATS